MKKENIVFKKISKQYDHVKNQKLNGFGVNVVFPNHPRKKNTTIISKDGVRGIISIFLQLKKNNRTK